LILKFNETLEVEDQAIQKIFQDKILDKLFTTAEFCNILGSITKKRQNTQKEVLLQLHMTLMFKSIFQH